MLQPQPERICILDTETTGLYHGKGDRIVEIGVTEIVGFRETANKFHVLVNPQGKSVDPDALRVHGHTDALLRKQKTFGEVVEEFLAFIGNSRIVIHNAKFDMGFINMELALLGLPPLSNEIVDSLVVARRLYPGQKNSLDVLMNRLDVDAKERVLHGAHIDALLLGRVWIKMMKLDQLRLSDQILPDEEEVSLVRSRIDMLPRKVRPFIPASASNPFDVIAHETFMAKNVKDSIWGKLRESMLTA